MKKLLGLLVILVISLGGYVHYHSWLNQSNGIKNQLQELAAGKSDRVRITYDAIETAGYPFRHEVSLKNPCVYFLDSEPSMSLTEGCLNGTMLLSYHPFSDDRMLFIETDGEFTLTLPKPDAEPIPLLFKGKLKQEYSLERGYEFARSSDILYFLENLQKATLTAKGLSIVAQEPILVELIQDLTGTLEYSRSAVGENSQEISFFMDYSTLLGDSYQAYQPPFNEIFRNLSADLKEFNKKSGVNTGRYDIALTIPSWKIIKDAWDDIYALNLEAIPSFSIDAEQSSKNNFFRAKGNLDVEWLKGDNNAYSFKVKNSGSQDLTNEGEKEFASLLQDAAKGVLRMMVDSATENGGNPSRALTAGHYDDLLKGFPSHLEVDLNMAVQKEEDLHKGKLSVVVAPLLISTEKGAVTVSIDYSTNEPFNAKVEIDQLVRVVDGLITRYNIIAKVIDIEYQKKIPHISEMERDHLLAILQKYSDEPENLPKTVDFTVTESSDGTIMIGKQQDIRALVGELAFFLQHLQQKMQKNEP